MSRKKIRIAINGFGRIGRGFFRVAFDHPEIEIVAVNDLADLENLAYLLRYDSLYGRYNKSVDVHDGGIMVDDRMIPYTSEANPSQLPWKALDVDIVVEATGRFVSFEKARPHLDAGAKRVVLSAPAKDDGETVTATPNVNEEALGRARITSNASCTTNAIAPVAAIMSRELGVEFSLLNTVKGYTSSQQLIDGPHKDYRRGRAAGVNMVPTTTGAAIATAKAIPSLKDRFDGIAIRVPVLSGSLLDFTFIASRETSVDEVNDIFRQKASEPEWEGILAVTDESYVSTDILKDPHGAVVDLQLTRVVGGVLVKVMAWYDNEWGYAKMLLKHVLSLTPFLSERS